MSVNMNGSTKSVKGLLGEQHRHRMSLSNRWIRSREVFKARCKKTNAYVAMKLILMDQEKEGFPITALREIKILQELRHQNIVRLIEVCRSASACRERERESAGSLTLFPFSSGSICSEQVLFHLRIL